MKNENKTVKELLEEFPDGFSITPNGFIKKTVLASSHFAAIAQNSVSEEKIFRELDRAQDESQLNPLIRPISDRAYIMAKQWIVWAKNKFPELSPYIVIPGDRGVIVEWKMSSDFVSVNFDETDCEMDIIFSKLNGNNDSANFSENKLEENLFAIISALKNTK